MSKKQNSMVVLILGVLGICRMIEATERNQSRPYEFSFNIADFQHRYEKKDAAGIVTGEYGFITADGVYHETAYATDKDGGFRITRMKNRKITSLKVAQEIFKGKPEVAKRVIQVLAKSCSGCGIPVHKTIENKSENESSHKNHQRDDSISEKLSPDLPLSGETTANEKNKNEQINPANASMKDVGTQEFKIFQNSRQQQSERGAGSGLQYRFNYTITSHGHQETGYQDGRKNGTYRTLGTNGTDAKVDYLSNEFGHQPNITFVNRQQDQSGQLREKLHGFTFEWIFDRR